MSKVLFLIIALSSFAFCIEGGGKRKNISSARTAEKKCMRISDCSRVDVTGTRLKNMCSRSRGIKCSGNRDIREMFHKQEMRKLMKLFANTNI